MFRKKILIIDDTEFMVKLTANILREKGYEVVAAYDGMDGVRIFVKEAFILKISEDNNRRYGYGQLYQEWRKDSF